LAALGRPVVTLAAIDASPMDGLAGFEARRGS
jgi:hypothetical protein